MGNGSGRARRRPSTPRTMRATNRLHIALILSVFFVLSIYSVDKLEADLLHYITSYDEESLSSSSQRRQLISDNVWEAELRERQLRATGPKKTQQRVQIQRKRMLEDVGGESGGGPPGDNGKGHRGPPQRYLNKHHFDDCVGETIASCQGKINAYVNSHKSDFGNRTSLNLVISKIREKTDPSYYKTVLTTNVEGTLVEGAYADGMVEYPWGWNVNGTSITVGPWNCTDMTPEECCTIIQEDVPMMDDNGNYMACFVEEPVGGVHNPEDEGRAKGVADASGKIVRPPIAH